MEITPIVKEDFVVIQDEEFLSEMIGKLKNEEKRSGLVFRKNKYAGLIEKKRLLRSRLDTTKTKVSKYVQPTPIISENADIIETAYMMFKSNLDYVPVERNKNIVGVIDGLDLVKLALDLPEIKHIKVDDVKLSKSVKVNKDDPVSTAISVMYDEHVDQVPVFDKGKLYGVISYRDILRRYLNWSPKRDHSEKFNKILSTRSAEVDIPHLYDLPVSTFSTSDNLVTTFKADKLKNAVGLMLNNHVSDVVVMEGDKVEGLLTVKNILRKIASIKIPKNFNIRFIGLNEVDLEPYEVYNIKKICSNEAFKLQRKLSDEFQMTIHLKEYKKDGNQHKYSVHMNIISPGLTFSSSQEDWRIETALRKTFNNAKNTLENRSKDTRRQSKEESFEEG